MKHAMRKLLSLLLALALTLGLTPGVFAADPFRITDQRGIAADKTAEDTGAQTDKHMSGNVTVPQTEPLRPAGEELYVPRRDLPSSYDSRNVGGVNYVTPVKNQAYGDCWAHAAMACIETYMIKHQVPVALNGTVGSAADLNVNLSENQHAYFTYTHAYDALGLISNDYTTFGNNLFQFGGSGDLSMYSLMRWTGPANEGTSALAYNRNYDNTNKPTTSTIDSQYAYNYDAGHVMSVLKIPTKNRDAVKQMIMTYGAGDFTYYSSDSSAADNTNGTYYCNQDSIVITTSYHNIDHAVTVVGWDDNFDKSNFKQTPAGNGAWIIKNSWGTGYGLSGYYYISYYDTASYNSNVFFYAVEPIDNYDNNYQYDGTTNFSNTRYVSSGSSFAQAFTANGAETLEAVALAAPANFSYTLKIYTGGELDVADPTTGATLATQQSGTLTYAGYQKIELENPVNLAAGQRFIVLFTNTSTGSKDMPVDMVGTYSYGYGWNISWTHAAHANSSYRCNSSWSNESASFNFRIKAYTTNERFNLTALTDDPSQGTVQVSGTRILVTPATGYGIDHVEVVSGNATFTIDGNTISVSATADCTLKVYFRRLDQHTVTFIAHNKVTTMTAYEGVPITLPTPEDEDITDPDNDDYFATFYGWVPVRCANADDEPAAVYDAGDSYTVTGDVTLYGLYWVEETLPSTLVESYDLVSGASNVTAGTYIITWNNTYYLPSETVRQSPLATSGISADTSTNKLNVSSQNPITSDMKWDFTATNDGKFTISHTVTSGNSSTTYYLAAKDASTGIYVLTSAGQSGYTYTWSLSDNSTIGLGMKAAGSRYLWVYNNQDWRYYSTSTSSGTLRLYKDNSTGSEGGTVEYFTTDFPDDCTHSWGDWIVTTAATCSTGGVETRICILCGATQTQGADPLPHNWTPGATVEPDCTTDGYTTYTCSRCGQTKHDDLITALGHDWVAGEGAEPTCTAPGTASATCRRCGVTDTVETEPALGHDWGDRTVTQEATCTAAGTRTHTCNRCSTSENETIPVLGHDFGAWYTVTAATADETGLERRDCTRCSAYETNVLPALGHDYRVLFIVPCGETAPAAMTSNTNTGITLPTMGSYTYNNVTYSFVGWSTATVSDATSAPSALTGAYTAPSDVTLYALYSCTVTSGSSVQSGYQLTTDAPAKDDKIILTRLVDSDYYAMTNGAAPSYSKLTVSGNFVTSPADSVIWDVKSASSGVYLYPTGNTSNSLHMNSSALKVASGTANGDIVFSLNSDRESFKGARADGARWIVTSGNYGFGCSATEGDSAKLYIFFKYVSGSTPTQTTHWTTEICPHSPAAAADENTVPPTALVNGHHDSVVRCSVCDAELSRETFVDLATAATAPVVNGVSLIPDGEIFTNAYITIPDSLVESEDEVWYVLDGGTPVKLSTADKDPVTGCYRFTVKMAAKEMYTNVRITLQDKNGDPISMYNANDNASISGFDFSVHAYLDTVLAAPDDYNAAYPGIVSLCKAISDYGYYAQHLFDYNLNDPNTVSTPMLTLPQTGNVLAALGSAADYSITQGTNVRYYGSSLLLESETTIRMYFRFTGSADGYLAYIGDAEGIALTRYAEGSSYYYVEITEIPAEEFATGHNVVVRNGPVNDSATDRVSVTNYSVFSYAKIVLTDGSGDELVNLVKSMWTYCQEAKEFFALNP